MKRILTMVFTTMLLSPCAFADTWTDPETGIQWTYTVVEDSACVDGAFPSEGDISIPATLGSTPVTTIGRAAFFGCSGLMRVTIPDSVTSIEDGAFCFCKGLTSVTIPSSVTFIASSAFRGCNNIYDATVPGWRCEIDFSSVTNLVISDGTTNIVDSAFSYCSGLTSVTIPNSVTSIGQQAFYCCSGLGDGVVIVDECVLTVNGDCPSSISLPKGTRLIAGGAFSGCSGLTSVTMPESVTSIGERAFSYCGGLTSFGVDQANPNYKSKNGLLLTKDGMVLVSGVQGNVTIPNGVQSIGNSAFEGCSGLMSVTIPNSVTSIGSQAFYRCSGLTSVTIPNSVTSIGSFVFGCCSGLTSVAIPSSVAYIGDCVFKDCSGMMSFTVDEDNPNYKSENGLLLTKNGKKLVAGVNGDVTIPSSVTSIGDNAFEGCSGLTSVTIPNSVTSIGEWAFEGCSGLTSVTIPDSVTSIGDYAFYFCSGLTSVTIPNIVTRIGSHVFYACGLTSVTIPSSVTSIGDQSFMYCSGLTSVTIPSGVTNIEPWAFCNCSGLTSVTIPSSVTSIGVYTFSGCSRLSSVTIPEGVTSIGDRAFMYCSGLTRVAIPSSVTSIGWHAFNGCSVLTSVTIPSGVASIGGYAFSGCSGLESVDFEGAPPEGLDYSCINQDAAIRYNVAYEDEWLPVIEQCGFTNATPYVPGPKPAPGEDEVAVVFVAPNGFSSMSVATYATNSIYGRLPEAMRDGFTFAGWYTSLDGTNRVSSFSAVDPLATTLYARWVEDDASLYAQWEANKYTVTFDSNGGEGSMAAQPFLYDQVQNLTNSAFTKLGYAFRGWSTTADGEVVYENCQSVSNLTAEAGFAVALFAKWEKVIDVLPEEVEEWVGYTLAPKFKKPGETATAYRKRFEEKFGDDYAAAFFKETGKIGQDGAKLQVWHDYVAGTDPLDESSQFTATITFDEHGVPTVDFKPKFDDPDEAALRLYKTWGKTNLSDKDWVEISGGHESDYNFFKVTVEMR